MSWLGTLLAPMVTRLLDWGLAKLFQFTGWAIKKIQARGKIMKKNSAASKEFKALREEILAAQEDGELTEDEIRRIIERARLPNIDY